MKLVLERPWLQDGSAYR